MAGVTTKLFRQVRGKAKEIDSLLQRLDSHFPAKECSSQLSFEKSLRRWARQAKPEGSEDVAAEVRALPVAESVRALIGDEGDDSKELDLSLGFEMIREMSRHLNGLEIALEWSELVKQSNSADNISDIDLIGIERGAFLVDRVSRLLAPEEEDDMGEPGLTGETQEIESLPLFSSDYQTSSLHPLDRKTMEQLDDIADEVRTKLKVKQEEHGHPPSPVEVLQEVNKVLFSQLGFRAASPQDFYDPTVNCLGGVLRERRGTPIPLCILYAAISTRVGLNVKGVRMPGYFLVKVDFGDPESQGQSQAKPVKETKEEELEPVEVQEVGTQEDITKGAEIEVYWNGDDKWYPAEVDSVDGNVICVNYWDNDPRHRKLEMENLNRLPDLHKDTLVFRLLQNVPPTSVDSSELFVGRRVEVFWLTDNTWYPGTVRWLDSAEGRVLVQYDDGDQRNTTLRIEHFGAAPQRPAGAPPAPPATATAAEGEDGQPLVFRLFDRPFNDESDATSCFVDPYRGGKVLCHAETSSLLREHGIQSSKFKAHLTPVKNPVVWMSHLKAMNRISQHIDGSEEEKDMWANQVMDLRKLELHSSSTYSAAQGAGEEEAKPEEEN